MMNAKRMHYLLLSFLTLSLLALVGGAYAINGFLGKQATMLANLKSQTQVLDEQQNGLKKAKKDIATYVELEKITQQVVPQDKDQAEAVREIVNIAATAGVELTSINFPASTLGAGVVPSAGATPAATSPSAAATAKPSLSQLTPVPSTPGVYKLQITIQNDSDTEVTYTQFYNLLAGLERNRRTAEVASIVIQPDANNRRFLTFTLTLNEYIKP